MWEGGGCRYCVGLSGGSRVSAFETLQSDNSKLVPKQNKESFLWNKYLGITHVESNP